MSKKQTKNQHCYQKNETIDSLISYVM